MWVASDHLVSSAVSATKSALPYLGPERLQWVSVTTLQSSISGQSPIKAADSRVHPPPSGPAFMVLMCVCVCVCVCVLATQSCLTVCDSTDCHPPGSSVHGISQARILEWVAISFSRGLPNPWIEPQFPVLQAETLLSELLGKPIVVLIHSSFLGTRVEQNRTRESAKE